MDIGPDKFEVFACIKFIVNLQCKKSDNIKAITDVYKHNASKKTTIYKWIKRFNEGRVNIKDDNRSTRLVTSISEGKIVPV